MTLVNVFTVSPEAARVGGPEQPQGAAHIHAAAALASFEPMVCEWLTRIATGKW